ncbi:hypothetical protein A6S26_16760 [Nostoc sp. ATCC 43529]|nr:hypothetical protein A6S26_16760 [Nostoc sp. ATCC 43529]
MLHHRTNPLTHLPEGFHTAIVPLARLCQRYLYYSTFVLNWKWGLGNGGLGIGHWGWGVLTID